jgi:nucleotide-binding universal stress UspA family protein
MHPTIAYHFAQERIADLHRQARNGRARLDPAATDHPSAMPFGRRHNLVLAPVTYHPFSEAMSLAANLGTHVVVLHVVQYHNTLRGRGFPFESAEDAAALVRAASFDVQLHGARASSAVVTAPVSAVAARILQAATEWGAEAIVLGSYRDRGLGRWKGKGIREHIIRNSNVAVVVAPSAPPRQRRAVTTSFFVPAPRNDRFADLLGQAQPKRRGA